MNKDASQTTFVKEAGFGVSKTTYTKLSIQHLAKHYKINPGFRCVAFAKEDELLNEVELLTLCMWLDKVHRIAAGERKVWWHDERHYFWCRVTKDSPPKSPPSFVSIKDEDQVETWILEALATP